MISELIIPESVLRIVYEGSSDQIEASYLETHMDDCHCKIQLRFYHLLTVFPELIANHGLQVSENNRFYNRYYWFSRAVRCLVSQYGPDAGLEQQKFKLIEYEGHWLDWEILEKIEKRAAQDEGECI